VRYSLEQSLKMIRDLLSALDYAHKQGIVHRDIKPANLLLEPGGRVTLTDFGVARIQDSGEATRTQGSMIGTLKYMAPEQVQGQKIDSRADLFSVGVVLYQLLTDKRPFDADNDFSIIHQIIGNNPPPPSSINPHLPAAIDAVVARALAKDRDQRFATARDFASALQSAIRRAEDATVVPPADPFRKADAGGTGSKGFSSMAGTGTTPSVITQEVELVYWKDIKDSTDTAEFEAFLEKFPAGIYADLARRRLRKLTSGTNTAPDQTILIGLGATGGTGGVVHQDLDATRLRTDSIEPAEKAIDTASGVHEPVTDQVRRIDKDAAVAQPVPAQLPAAKKRIAAVAGVGALVLAGLAAFMTMGSPEPSQASFAGSAPSASPTPASAALQAELPAGASVVAGDVRRVAAAGSAASPGAPQAKASGPGKPARTKAGAAAPVLEATRPAPAQAAPGREETRIAAAPSVPGAPSPAEACKDKSFLSREFCLADACEKPGSRSHPLCVTWREDKRLRDESKIRQ
jgi:serine/threonine-protein kinase